MKHFISVCGLSLAWVTSENSTSTGMPTSFDSIFFAGPYLFCYCLRSWPHLSVVPRQLSAVQSPTALVQVPSSTLASSFVQSTLIRVPLPLPVRWDFRSKNLLSGFAPKQTHLLPLSFIHNKLQHNSTTSKKTKTFTGSNNRNYKILKGFGRPLKKKKK